MLCLPLLWSHRDDMVLQGRAANRKTRATQCKLPPRRENSRELCFPEGPPLFKGMVAGNFKHHFPTIHAVKVMGACIILNHVHIHRINVNKYTTRGQRGKTRDFWFQSQDPLP